MYLHMSLYVCTCMCVYTCTCVCMSLHVRSTRESTRIRAISLKFIEHTPQS